MITFPLEKNSWNRMLSSLGSTILLTKHLVVLMGSTQTQQSLDLHQLSGSGGGMLWGPAFDLRNGIAAPSWVVQSHFLQALYLLGMRVHLTKICSASFPPGVGQCARAWVSVHEPSSMSISIK